MKRKRCEVGIIEDGRGLRVSVNGLRAERLEKSTRVVFVCGGLVVKIAIRPEPDDLYWTGREQNRAEVKLWKRAKKSRDGNMFAEVYDWHPRYKWIVAKRIVGRRADLLSHPKVAAMEEKYAFDAEGQFLMVGRRPVIYDYGCYDKRP